MNNTTELVFILDRSGSMDPLTKDTIGGFNSLLREQREKDGGCLVTTVLFNSRMQRVHDRLDICEVPEMTEKDYRANGSTALIDAIGETIGHIEKVHKYIRPEDVPEHTLFMITTDGLENASRMHTSDEVKQMIERKKKDGWEFVFVGANIDAVETARAFGIDRDHAVDYESDGEGTKILYSNLSKLASNVRANAAYDSSWSEESKAYHEKKRK